ncbi:MAG TPA: glycine--tRNA ligase subunit beta [Woeseiaceae bacterium]|nr:glycine--tRNA ligase subunit beta [Woeseiaceae bacterium]
MARANAKAADFLVEIGTEELPPKALRRLMQAFAEGIAAGLERERLAHGELQAFATPRRLAVLVQDLAVRQADRATELKGPPVSVAFDAEGRPTAAARAFAEKCGVAVEALGRTASAKGEWLTGRSVDAGRAADAVLPAIVQDALDKLPIPRRMRWGDSDAEFVRPVRWLLMLHGGTTVAATVLGQAAGNVTRGHRFLAEGEIAIGAPRKYAQVLEQKGRVVADFAARCRRIVDGVKEAAASVGGTPLGDDELYDEVTALTEWPVPMIGRFDESFLDLPREVIVATLTHHQRYFPIVDAAGNLQAEFVTVANLESAEPERVREGNQRVIRPRLADAAFFRDQDLETRLADRLPQLERVVYSEGLGSLHDKTARVARLAVEIASKLGLDATTVERAAWLSRCDLTTGMVGEFPELQGVMGSYYAAASGEPEAVARAIREIYLPRHAGDALPATGAGRALSLAERIDSLAGQFALGRKPTGNRDPQGLRRAALGIVRILVEQAVDLDLPALLAASVADQPVSVADAAALTDELYEFVVERMRAWHVEGRGTAVEVFESVRGARPASLHDFGLRLEGVTAFVELPQAESLAAANKRIANILRQSGEAAFGTVAAALLEDGAERELHDALKQARSDVQPLMQQRDYAAVLARLAALRDPVDRFFDDVMVMAKDDAQRRNRLALLAGLRELFLRTADISRLSIG